MTFCSLSATNGKFWDLGRDRNPHNEVKESLVKKSEKQNAIRGDLPAFRKSLTSDRMKVMIEAKKRGQRPYAVLSKMLYRGGMGETC